MAISKVIRPVSDVKVGIKAETSFGGGLADDTAFRQLPIVQVQKPVFNTFRESRSLSGRG